METCECEHRGAGMCPAWRQVHLTRPASCTPARALQHSSQSLSKCAGATSTTISSAKSRFHNMRQVSPFMYACLPQKYDAQNRRTALASPHSHATCQPHRCQVRFCLQELQLPHKARSMYSLSSMELFFCNCLAKLRCAQPDVVCTWLACYHPVTVSHTLTRSRCMCPPRGVQPPSAPH